ncbi:Fic family protein [Mucilaginibacter phyllosphaerae]|uniref:Fic family protein n=1 Tax=Mucilaginibacter phyllosphaerae TaxID=1812349 RepID=A0A4Y8A9L2_9SPHI|nr:Fic family protein [Mucilaginibacter phyllosphaerae]MBB3970566.1 Fic family protein [Mucilaginibacter phyllosphaerae]TEW64574.1 Fic family protein [Mucilaginibacter phyllosphaerae]GGH19581.1 hypothetical protein GCM10007352_31010 [Mucilaginibacter phyllosphaerae]
MNLDLEIEFSKAPVLQEIDALKKQIDNMRPLPPDIEGRVMQKLRLDWNYNSNAIEGNKLSYGETVAFLMEGITAKGKPLKDHLDIRGHNEAIHFLTELVKDERGITESDIRALHKMILVERYKVDAQTADGKPTTKWVEIGEYKSMSNHVQTATGETHYYATPEEVKLKMPELIEWYNELKQNKEIHPVVAAALFHHKFVAIHPFDDGNGRLSRILMNLILMQDGYPPAVVRMDDRKNYYSLLSRADNKDAWPFVEYIVEQLQRSLEFYIEAANGDDINDDEDIDKEIALFKMELQNEVITDEKKSESVVKRVFEKNIKEIIEKIFNKSSSFDEFFESHQRFLDYLTTENQQKISRRDSGKESNWIFTDLNFDDCESITICCFFKKFKNKKEFDVQVRWSVNFLSYNYTIVNALQNELLSKTYYESISNQEKQDLIKLFVNDIKNGITEKRNI